VPKKLVLLFSFPRRVGRGGLHRCRPGPSVRSASLIRDRETCARRGRWEAGEGGRRSTDRRARGCRLPMLTIGSPASPRHGSMRKIVLSSCAADGRLGTCGFSCMIRPIAVAGTVRTCGAGMPRHGADGAGDLDHLGACQFSRRFGRIRRLTAAGVRAGPCRP